MIQSHFSAWPSWVLAPIFLYSLCEIQHFFESELPCWGCYHHEEFRDLGAAPAPPGLWKEGTCHPETTWDFLPVMSFSGETLFRKNKEIAVVLVTTSGVTLVMKDSLPSSVSDWYFTPAYSQWECSYRDGLATMACHCWMCCWVLGHSLVFLFAPL